MFKDEVQAVVKAGQSKVSLLRNNKMGYMVSSILAGLYIGLGIMLIFSIGGILTSSGSGATKIMMGASFGVALSLVIFAGVLCNILVCLAVWCSIKLKSEIGKLVMVFWCLYVFITAGFEHSVANMTLLAIGLFSSHSAAITISGFIYNIGIVTLGNIVGGVLLAVSYHIISRNKEK